MKSAYIRAIIALTLTGTLAACDENSWNNHLDGFKEFEEQPTANQQAIEYTLTNADYSAIASNSDNTAMAGTDAEKDALKAVGTQHRFSADAPASLYVPAFLGSTSFPYFTLTDGSSVKLTYNVAVDEPEVLTEASSVQTFSVTDDIYHQTVWGGAENYVNAFAPSKPASDYLPSILAANVDVKEGKYCIVNYLNATQEPVFGGAGAPSEPVEVLNQPFNESLGEFYTIDVDVPDALDYVWTWGGANYGAKASAYKDGAANEAESWLVSPAIDLTDYDDATLTFEHAVNFFTDAATAENETGAYFRIKGGEWQKLPAVYPETLSWTFVESGELRLAGSGGNIIELGFKYSSTAVKSGTWEVKNLVVMAAPTSSRAISRAATYVPTESLNAVYRFDGNKWVVPADFVVLQPADYTAMGQNYPNLSTAEPYLSKWLDSKYAFAAADDVKYVFWARYANKETSYVCSPYICSADGTWAPQSFVAEETNQFVKTGGKWMYDPNVYITLPAGRNVEISTLYYQTVVDWVYETICRPLGDTSIKSGLYYVTSYGNNEYYSGASAYQGNVDLRASAAKAQYPAEYSSMSDDEVVELEKNRFFYESFLAAIETIHADAKPVEGITVLYTFHFAAYNGSTTDYYDAVYEVTAPGKFTPVSCSWWENGTGK